MKKAIVFVIVCLVIAITGCQLAPVTTSTDISDTENVMNTENAVTASADTTEPETDETATAEETTAPPETDDTETTTKLLETTAPEITIAETTLPETTAQETTVPETTVAETVVSEMAVSETTAQVAEKGKEFKSLQRSHVTPDDLTDPTNMASWYPGEMRPGGGKYCTKAARVAFQVLDCGFKQFESIVSLHSGKLPPETIDMLEKIASGKLKIWLTDLDGNKIDYVYANRNNIVVFEMYPGEYRLLYEDDGIYKTSFSSIIKVVDEGKAPGANFSTMYYRIYDDYDTPGYTAYLCIYNYKRYKPVTIRVTDADTGNPVSDVKTAYAVQYLNEKSYYMLTDGKGMIRLNSIFDIITASDPGLITSWRYNIELYFEKDGYGSVSIKDAEPTETSFEIKLKKS